MYGVQPLGRRNIALMQCIQLDLGSPLRQRGRGCVVKAPTAIGKRCLGKNRGAWPGLASAVEFSLTEDGLREAYDGANLSNARNDGGGSDHHPGLRAERLQHDVRAQHDVSAGVLQPADH